MNQITTQTEPNTNTNASSPSSITMEPISLNESKRLIELENKIAPKLQSFVEVGTALAEIRSDRLYKSDYATFEEYCVGKWGIKRAHANRLIEAAGIATDLAPTGAIPTERAARALARVPKVKRSTVLAAATAKAKSEGRNVRAKDIDAAAQPASSIVIDIPATSDGTATEAPIEPVGQGHIPRAKTQKDLQDWYSRASKPKRAEFLVFILTSFDLVVQHKAEFQKIVEFWLEHRVTEAAKSTAEQTPNS